MIDFEEFWQIWPKKKAKKPAEKAWLRLKPDADLLEKIKLDIENRFKFGEWDHTRKQYIPNASTYLNQELFNDEEYVTYDNNGGWDNL